MDNKRGIPKEVLEELDVKKIAKPKTKSIVTAVVESHQVKLPVPGEIRREINFKKGQKVKVTFNKEKREIIYKI